MNKKMQMNLKIDYKTKNIIIKYWRGINTIKILLITCYGVITFYYIMVYG